MHCRILPLCIRMKLPQTVRRVNNTAQQIRYIVKHINKFFHARNVRNGRETLDYDCFSVTGRIYERQGRGEHWQAGRQTLTLHCGRELFASYSDELFILHIGYKEHELYLTVK